MNTSFVFVCQSGLIECQALLLAMSLRRYTDNEEIIAAWPKQFGDLHPYTLRILKSLDVKVVEIVNDFDPVYPCGNKMFAANLPIQGEYLVFLDSDLVCVRSPKGELTEHPATAIATGRFDVITHREWMNCHEVIGLKIETGFRHLRAPIVSCHCNSGLPKRWLQNSRNLYHSVSLRKIRQIDQISLALTAQTVPNFFVHEWKDNPLMLSPSEIYLFENSHYVAPDPIFLVLQKGWLYYERQGHPEIKSENPNSLAYYDEIRSLIYSLISEHPSIDRIPSWMDVHDLYFSQLPLDKKVIDRYLIGVEGDQK